jgi:DNA-binding NarL/FixJ family response regulator
VNTNSLGQSPSRIYVLDQNRLLRQALLRVFRRHADFTVVGDGTDGAESIEELTVIPCNVVPLNSLRPCNRSDTGRRQPKTSGK